MANLFIAMGGSGLKTIREIRNKQREGDYFLFIDTDTNDLQGFSERETVDLAKINVSAYLQTEPMTNPVRQRVNDWLDVNARATMKNGPLKDGASANRPQGRLAIASIATEFNNRIKELVSSINNIHKNVNDPLNTYIVLSVAGGTGSSIYLDLTQIIYDQLYLLKGHDFNKPTTVLYMPDVFVQFQEGENIDRYKTNVFGFWKELDAIQRDYFESINSDILIQSGNNTAANASATRPTNFSKFAIVSDTINSGNVPFQAFQSAILIDHENTEGQSTDIKQRYKDVARLLEMISVKNYGSEIRSALDNTILPNAVTSLNNKLPWVKQYWSAGYSEIRGGSDFFEEYVKTNLKTILFEAFLGVNRASKDGLDDLVNPIYQDHFLSFIEIDNYSPYINIAREENNKKINLHAIIDNYWKEKIEVNLNKQYTSGIETKDESSADGLKRLFDNDIKDIALKIVDYLNLSGYQIDVIVKKVLGEFYEKSSEIALAEGLQKLSFVLEELDTKIDDLSMNYDSILKGLANEKTGVIVDDQDVINSNLVDTITRQYTTIKEGPSFMTLRKEQWYETEMTTFKKLIIASYKYQTQELALKLKKEICAKISLGHSGDMLVRSNVTKLIGDFQIKIDNDIKPKSHKKLIEKYLTYKDNALTTIIPDVSNFATTETFVDSKTNVFKRIFENQSGLATGINNGKSYFIIKKSDNSSSNSKSIEELLRTTFSNSKFLINNIQSGEISSVKFIEEFEKLIEENLFSNLKSILTDGQSQQGVASGYSKYSSYTLNDWISEDSSSFNEVKKQFQKRGSVFCNLTNANVAKQLWLSPKSIKSRIDEIYKVDGNLNIPNYNYKETNEDVIVSIKYVDNLSFDNYKKYIQYKDHYSKCLSKNINNYYPHIDVRFKKAMAKSLHNVEDQTPILNELKTGMNQSQNSNNTLNRDAINFLDNYSNIYFLAKFYEKLKNDSNISIFKNLVMYDDAFSNKMTLLGRNEMFNPPIYIDGVTIKCFESSDIQLTQDKGIVWLSGNTGDYKNLIEVLTPQKLSSDFQKVILLSLPLPSDWIDIKLISNIIEINLKCIRLRYSLAQDKTIFKNVLINTINEVKDDIFKLSPSEQDYKKVFDQFYIEFSNNLNKFI